MSIGVLWIKKLVMFTEASCSTGQVIILTVLAVCLTVMLIRECIKLIKC